MSSLKSVIFTLGIFCVLTCLNLQGALIGIFTENMMARWSDSPSVAFGQTTYEKVSHIEHLIYGHGNGLAINDLGKIVLTEGVIEFLEPAILFVKMQI